MLFRKKFQVNDVSAISGVVLQALYDDGFKIWINGQAVADGTFNMAAGELPYTATARYGNGEITATGLILWIRRKASW